MNSYQTVRAWARGGVRRLSACVTMPRCWRLTMGLTALLVAAILGGSGLLVATPVTAAPDGPRARLQVVIKQVEVHDDRDGIFRGEGEIVLEAEILRCNEGARLPCRGAAQSLARFSEWNSADSGEVIALERLVPAANSSVDPSATAELGFPVYAGERYVVWFSAWESDACTNGAHGTDCSEQMGEVFQVITADRLHEAFGVHMTRSFRGDGKTYGDYTITYEIRRAPLPDLQPDRPTVQSLPGTDRSRVCMPVTNTGSEGAGRFIVSVIVVGYPQIGGNVDVSDLAPGSSVEPCVELVIPPASQVTLVTEVDIDNYVAEYNETDNVFSSAYQSPAPAPSPTPSVALPDLIVKEIKVNGRVPDGKDDCKDGKNDVTVTVKNQGTARAGRFDVRLAVDADKRPGDAAFGVDEDQDEDDDRGVGLRAAGERTAVKSKAVDVLDPGQQREVRFENVRPKKGPHTLAATADAEQAVPEAKEENNALTVTARCSDDD